MLTSCFGLSLRTGTNIIAIVNSITSIFYIIFNVWEFNRSFGYSELHYRNQTMFLDELFFNYITLLFMLSGFILLFANFGLKQATIKNETHKIYLWLLVSYVQLGTILTIEIVMTFRYNMVILDTIKLIICFILIDAILVFQLLIVHSFYYEEKLVEENNYSKLRSELTSQLQEENLDEFQNVEL
ncbi:uncharacterized protein LOC112689347 [Sipha flava]|uniref:Uncharacterized protein LOC112689347 n=1 Tax=Sipha flava TaxID=143950 RepID=A0A2S2R7Y2_9HEMI|nr:uncharacterized protein LOC112689347 [Sipha flava]